MRRKALLGLVIAALLVPLAATPADAAPRTAQPVVSLRTLVNSVPRRNDPVGFSGSVTKVPVGTVVSVQRKAASGWRTIGTLKTAARGAYSGSFTATTLGRTTYRATVGATGRTKAAVSRSASITFFDVFGLLALKPVSIDQGVTAETEVGEPRAGTMLFTFDGQTSLSAAWSIGGACRTFYFTAGTKSGTARLTVLVQDELGGVGEAYTRDLVKDEPVQARLDVRDVKLLGFQMKDTTPVAGVHVAGIGAPTLLCSKDPSKIPS